jgi:hypothetical protein
MPAAQVQALRQLETQYQRAGDLQGMLAVQQERKRFLLDPRGSSIPAVQAPAELARLLNAYKTHFSEIAAERDRSRTELQRRYLDALKKLQVTLTQQGNIQEAKRVMQLIEGLGAPPTASVSPTEPMPPPAVPPPAAATASGAAKTTESGDDFFKDWFE